jgi:hypothetical protein
LSARSLAEEFVAHMEAGEVDEITIDGTLAG